MQCNNCGCEMTEGSNFCKECGSEVGVKTFSSGVNTKELGLFVGVKKKQYYTSKWLNLDKDNKNISWNWASFFLNFFWLGYRKMYIHSIIVGAIYLTIIKIVPDKAENALGMLMCILFGLIGNKIYYSYANKDIIKIKESFKEKDEQESKITEKGGTSVLFAIIFSVIYLTIAFIW